VTGNKRVKSLPDVPTLKEQGIDVVVTSWQGLFAPAKTPATSRQDREGDQGGDEESQVGGGAGQDGLEQPPERTRAEFTKFVSDEHAFWGKTLKELKIEME
jgi:tripartite-type tricarboxylate transporter receptor subunit TctC